VPLKGEGKHEMATRMRIRWTFIAGFTTTYVA